MVDVVGDPTDEFIPPWAHLFDFRTDNYTGYVKTYQEAFDLIREFEISSNTKYVVTKHNSRQRGKYLHPRSPRVY
jgi:hypothetical protein